MKTHYPQITLLLSIIPIFLFSCSQPEQIVQPNQQDQPEQPNQVIPVSGVMIDQPSIKVVVGETYQLKAVVSPSNASDYDVIWTSSVPSVATVSSTGLVTGLMEGASTITATAGGKTGVCTVNVKKIYERSVTLGADHITAVGAVLHGKANLGATGSSNLIVGFQYSTFSGILPSNSITIEAKEADSDYNYSINLSGLEPDVTYYYRSFVRENEKDDYGETMMFKSKELGSMLHTEAATNITAVSAKLNATLDLNEVKYSHITVGFYYGTKQDELSEKVLINDKLGTISTCLSVIEPTKKYYYQVFAILDGKEYKGEMLSFTTKNVESLIATLDATDISATSSTLKAKLDLNNVEYNSISYGFYFGKSSSSFDKNVKVEEIMNNQFVLSLKELEEKTQYWYKAYVIIDNQTFFGEIKSFSTDLIHVESISLDMRSYIFKNTGGTLNLHATVLPSNATDKSITWTSGKTSVATVDDNGVVTAVSIGTAIITAKTNESGKMATCAITVKQLVSSITFDKTQLELDEGDNYQLTATITPSDATNKTIKWSSSDESIATVSTSGVVTAVSKGTATIRAVSYDGGDVSASCLVKVKSKEVTITIKPTKITIYNGESRTISATVTPIVPSNSLIWKSSDASIATVSSSGTIRGVSRGKAIITVTISGESKVNATCDVEVKQYVTGIRLDKTTLSLSGGEEQLLTAIITPENANDKSLSWTTGDSTIATVDANGKVTGISNGSTTITASAKDKSWKYAQCSVQVTHLPEAVDMGLSVKWATFNLGARTPEDCGFYFAWGEIKPKNTYTWDSYQYCKGTRETLTKYNYESSYGTVDNKHNFGDYNYTDDAARRRLGGTWRTPTDWEWANLLANCSWSWITINGVNGYKVTAKNGNSIFLPANGHMDGPKLYWKGSYVNYWSSVLYGGPAAWAFCMEGYSGFNPSKYDYTYNLLNHLARYWGLSIRPVCD